MHRCYLPVITGELVSLPADEGHHLTRVLRAREGAAVIVFDGDGHEWEAVIAEMTRREVRVRIGRPREVAPEPPVVVTMAVALLKGDQMTAVVRDATAMGAGVIWPFVSDHVVIPESDWRARTADRWQRVAVASAKQCGRAFLPAIREIARFSDVVAASAGERLVLCVEPERLQAISGREPAGGRPSRATVCVGPEGGWSEEEVALAVGRHPDVLSLGPRTLRAEIAPTVALSVLWERWGWR